MPFKSLLLRQLLLVQRLHQARGNPVTFQELQRYLLDETTVGDFRKSYSKKTFERDGNVIAEIFGVTIRSRRNKGYYLAAETDEALTDTHQRLLEAFELQNFLRLPQALAGYVQTEPRRPRGLEHLRPLLRAAQAGHLVAFDYQKHWQDAPRAYTAGPLLLREFRGRWYVLAVRPDTGKLACFGLDRIRGLRATSQPFAPPPHFDAATYYQHAFGITRPDDGTAPQEIRLRFAPVQGRYVLGYPLHASQQLLQEDAAGILLSLTVYDTHDLRMELLSYGAEVEVLAPPELRAWMRAEYQAARTAPHPLAPSPMGRGD